MRQFLKTFLQNVKAPFVGRNVMWNLVAIASTYILVVTNVDWNYFLLVRNEELNSFFFPALPLGGLLPILLPLSLILAGYALKKNETRIIGYGLAQAAILGSLISSLYKAFTGRIQPNTHDLATNISDGFQFGFLKHGIFWGWPSSHTTIAFAMACALIGMYPKNRPLLVMALTYALYIAIGVSLSIHWFSDVIAGIIIGTLIGLAVGKSFRAAL